MNQDTLPSTLPNAELSALITKPTLSRSEKATLTRYIDANIGQVARVLIEIVKAKPLATKPKQKGRGDRWNEAASKANEALTALKDVQQEYQDWLDNLPENLQSSTLSDKLTAVCDLDIEGAQSTVEEAEGADLPLGFGRD